MPKGRKHLTREDNTWLATCFAKDPKNPLVLDQAECDWDRVCPTEEIAKIVSTLHVLVKHPDRYKELTGKDPGEMLRYYKGPIEALRRHL